MDDDVHSWRGDRRSIVSEISVGNDVGRKFQMKAGALYNIERE